MCLPFLASLMFLVPSHLGVEATAEQGLVPLGESHAPILEGWGRNGDPVWSRRISQLAMLYLGRNCHCGQPQWSHLRNNGRWKWPRMLPQYTWGCWVIFSSNILPPKVGSGGGWKEDGEVKYIELVYESDFCTSHVF